MIEIREQDELEEKLSSIQFLYIYTPFCGTCQLARKMLETLEYIENPPTFYTINASLFPNFMQKYQIESVPCLLILNERNLLEKIYAFHSVPFLLEKMRKY
jgi:thiol-disulfide isomerase/thioredoxin